MTMAKRARRSPPIDALRALAADPNVVEVRVGGRTVASLPRARAESLGAVEGAAWTPALAARVSTAAAEALAREAALAFLARRAWSASLLRARLARAGHDEAAAAAAVASLVADGWLDDRAYAQARAGQLSRRGALAAEALALVEEGVAEREARAAARAEAGTSEDLVREARAARREGAGAARVAGRFARRGFDADTIRAALERAGFELDA
jgi:SOS response regulatory protein OraA/RecX